MKSKAEINKLINRINKDILYIGDNIINNEVLSNLDIEYQKEILNQIELNKNRLRVISNYIHLEIKDSIIKDENIDIIDKIIEIEGL